MAKKIVTLDLCHLEADVVAVWGKVVNVYDSFANAIANGDTGLVSVFAVNRLTGAIASDATVQRGKNSTAGTQTGIAIDEFGKFVFGVDDAITLVYLNSACGRQGGPLKVQIEAAPVVEESSSSGE
jgi:hypothetical protein